MSTDNRYSVIKQQNDLMKRSRAAAKRDSCAICGCSPCSFCNSHTIPQFILKRIALGGHVLHPAAVATEEDIFVEEEKGINNTWTFHLICRNCDNTFFSDYENETALLSPLSNKMMAEIALKNILLQLDKRYIEIPYYNELQRKYQYAENKEVLDDAQRLDVRDYEFERKRARKIIQKNLKSGFVLFYWKKLPYTVPIATQSAIAVYKGINGDIVNDPFDYSPKVRTEDLHVGVFPLNRQSVVFAFYHKDDRRYVRFEREFKRLTEEEKLKSVVYLLLKYTENICASPLLRDIIQHNVKIQMLLREYLEAPNLGYGTAREFLKYEPVKIEEIPNLLSEEYSLEKLRQDHDQL